MPAIISAQELRDVLGVSDSLYSDVYLDQIIDSAEQVILPMLTAYSSAITSYTIRSGVIFFTTQRLNAFVEGQSVVVTGLGDIDATYTVIANPEYTVLPFTYPFTPNRYVFRAAIAEADTATVIPVIPAGLANLDGSSAADLYANTPPIKSAILVVSTEIFQSVIAPGNMTNNVDFNPSPFVLGRSLQNRVIGLLNPFIDVEIFAQ
tara:strand:- start:5639 stop:6256 length:618 start_codon:yes stop_codon:yes gene_type:complete